MDTTEDCLRIKLMTKNKVLFLCTGNSCRSQMAEAIVNSCLGNKWQGFSVGSRPAGFVHPFALLALTEIGIDHQGRSKSVDEFRQMSFDLIITLCDTADEECPIWLGRGRRIHMPLPDPASVTGSQAEVMASFRSVRDRIAREIIQLLI